MQIRVDRDSVSAGDDVDGHTRVCDVDGRRTLVGLVADLVDDGYLPRIQGGSACWIVRDVPRGRPVAVVAVTPDFRTQLHPLDAMTTPVVSDVGTTLYFEYQMQRSPQDVIDELRRVLRT